MSEIHAYLEKATRSFHALHALHAAGLLLPGRDADFAVSRDYNGCFYVAEALPLDEGLHVPTHAG